MLIDKARLWQLHRGKNRWVAGTLTLGALEQALKYGMFDLTRLETLVLRHVAGDFFALPGADDDDGGDDEQDDGQDDTTHQA